MSSMRIYILSYSSLLVLELLMNCNFIRFSVTPPRFTAILTFSRLGRPSRGRSRKLLPQQVLRLSPAVAQLLEGCDEVPHRGIESIALVVLYCFWLNRRRPLVRNIVNGELLQIHEDFASLGNDHVPEDMKWPTVL